MTTPSHGHPEDAVLAQNVVKALEHHGWIERLTVRMRRECVDVVRVAIADSHPELDVHTEHSRCGATTKTPGPGNSSNQMWEHECFMRIDHEHHQCHACDFTWPNAD